MSGLSAEQWDHRAWVIRQDLTAQGYPEDEAREIAEFEATEQFGERPAEVSERG